MNIRKSQKRDLAAVAAIYDAIHLCEEQGKAAIGWIRDVYPTAETAARQMAALFVMEDEGRIVASAIINRTQVPAYADAHWHASAPDDEVMVLHTLTVDPAAGGRGYGKAFVKFYEDYALKNGCRYLRMDTNAVNTRARSMYKHLGYLEADIVSCTFNGIPNVSLVCLEKEL